MNLKRLTLFALILPLSGYGISENDAQKKELIEARNHVAVRLAATSALLLSSILKHLGLSEESLDPLTTELEDCQKEIIKINKEYNELTK